VEWIGMIKLSICIPAYNRVRFLELLLDSILDQDVEGLEVVICEDVSPERTLIREEVNRIITKRNLSLGKIKYFENEKNLGYDRNFRNLLEKSEGDYCLFMGNDDILAPGAIKRTISAVSENEDVAVIARSYLWFLDEPSNVQDTIKHLPSDKLFTPGIEGVQFMFRRVGFMSGIVFKRDLANEIATDRFDGHLFYQMYLAGMLSKKHSSYYISEVQAFSRGGIEPDFGNADVEKDNFKPGGYVYEGRVYMVKGMLSIADYIDDSDTKELFKVVKKDVAKYFYPYIRDQLGLPLISYISMVNKFGKLGMKNELFFYIHVMLGFILKKNGYDYCVKVIRKVVGHTPVL